MARGAPLEALGRTSTRATRRRPGRTIARATRCTSLRTPGRTFGRAILPALALVPALVTACFDAPDYAGLTCAIDTPCPSGFVCGTDGLCTPRDAWRGDAGAVVVDAASTPCADHDVPPPAGTWLLSYHPLTDDGLLDLGACLGEERVDAAGDLFDWTVSRSALAQALVGDASDPTRARLGVLARARPSLAGATRFTFTHSGPLRLRTGGVPLYDGGRTELADGEARGYGHGAQSLVAELVATSSTSGVSLAWANECSTIGEPTVNTWRVRYFRVLGAPDYRIDRSDCLGAELLFGTQLSLDFSSSSPAIVAAYDLRDRFGAEYSAERTFATSTTLRLYHDDGLRIWIDGELRYEDWRASQTTTSSLVVPAGTHAITLEYYENLGIAGLRVTW